MNDQSYVVRELQPTEDKVNLEPLCGKMRRLEQLVRTTASVVAWGQLRSGGIRGSATVYDLRDFAKDDRWQKALLSYIFERRSAGPFIFRSLLYTWGKRAMCLKIHVQAADINLRTRGFLKLKFVRDSMSTTTSTSDGVTKSSGVPVLF